MVEVLAEQWACARPMGGYRGIYPGGMMERVISVLSLHKSRRILHQFGGSVLVMETPYETVHKVDINPAVNPTYLEDARTMEGVPDNFYDLVIADPPYDAQNINYGPKLYSTKPVKPYSFVRAGLRVTKLGGFYAILHQLVYRAKPELVGSVRWGCVTITTGPNMRVRCLNIFQKDLEQTELEVG